MIAENVYIKYRIFTETVLYPVQIRSHKRHTRTNTHTHTRFLRMIGRDRTQHKNARQSSNSTIPHGSLRVRAAAVSIASTVSTEMSEPVERLECTNRPEPDRPQTVGSGPFVVLPEWGGRATADALKTHTHTHMKVVLRELRADNTHTRAARANSAHSRSACSRDGVLYAPIRACSTGRF